MKYSVWLPTCLLIFACTSKENKSTPVDEVPVTIHTETVDTLNDYDLEAITPTVYTNERFREVTVEKVDANQFRIKGQAQIFEANFNWVIEDGHEELKSGFQMTDAGAPEWGNFDFVLEAKKKRENSTLTLILFETSAKDGSRQYELPVVLE